VRRTFHSIILTLPLLLLGSCAKLIVPQEVSPHCFTYKPWKVREDELQAITKWKAKGAFSFQVKGGKLRIANYTWTQVGQIYDIFIRANFDVFGAQIKGGPSWAWLYRGDHAPVKAHSPEKLMQKELGYSIPIDDLVLWIRGMPAASKYRARFDRFGHIKTLRQDGWTITFSRYTRFVDHGITKADVPRLLELKRPSGLVVKIVVNIWSK